IANDRELRRLRKLRTNRLVEEGDELRQRHVLEALRAEAHSIHARLERFERLPLRGRQLRAHPLPESRDDDTGAGVRVHVLGIAIVGKSEVASIQSEAAAYVGPERFLQAR